MAVTPIAHMAFRTVQLADAEAMVRFYRDNALHLRPWEPVRGPEFYNKSFWRARLREIDEDHRTGRSAQWVAVDPDVGDIVAVCNLSNIIYGAFRAAYLGYAVAEIYQGAGVMRALCRQVIDDGFSRLQLHRIMANYMPCNVRSRALLRNLGFEEEGLAREYLKINGRWEDHILTALINPNLS